MKYERHIRSTALQQRNRMVIVLIGITAPPINLYNSYRISNVFVTVIYSVNLQMSIENFKYFADKLPIIACYQLYL